MELGAVGWATVNAILPCPEIEPGEGTVVTGTFKHQANEQTRVLRLALEGQHETTGVTDNHPYWSVDRQEFIPAGNLVVGETVDTVFGERRVESLTPIAADDQSFDGYLYNLETTEHVYRVGTLATLVHNRCLDEEVAPKSMHVGDAGHHVPAIRKSRGRPFEVERGDLSRPTIHVIGDETAVGEAHWRMHNAERTLIGPRQGDFVGTDSELFEAYRKSYRNLTDIRVDVRSPDGSSILGKNVSLEDAINLLESFLTGKN